jgi:methionyl-tRNA formyltransferase
MSQVLPLRIIFAGTPEFAAIHLRGLLTSADFQHEIVAVYTQPDRPSGRGKELKPSPVKQVALDHNIPIFQPTNFKNPVDQQTLADLKADLMIVVAYGLLLPRIILDAPKHGCINVHASLLPRWRGAAPIQRAIEAGDTETGVTIMQMDAGLDTGDMLIKAQCAISATDTGGTIHDTLAEIGLPALVTTVGLIAKNASNPVKQNDALTCYAPKISKEDAIIDWQRPVDEIAKKIRAFNPFPIAYTSLNGERIKIWQAAIVEQPTGSDNLYTGAAGTIIQANKKQIIVACSGGYLSLQQLQLPGGKAMNIAALMNSKATMFALGTRFDT